MPFDEEGYIPIDDAVAKIRNELPLLTEQIRERVDTISHTTAQLDELLSHVDQEKAATIDRVRVEFNQFEMALRKRLGSVLQRVEDEVSDQVLAQC